MKKNKTNLWTAFLTHERAWHLLTLTVTLLLAATLRLVKLGELPNGLNRDEASLGYTAYGIQQSGSDERGNKYPINVKSFGDWKLGGYIYTLVPFIMTFGLEDWVVRLPSALAGIGSIYLAYLCTASLGKEGSKKITTKKDVLQNWLPEIVALGLTFSPWHLHVSRIAYESNLGLFFLLLGWYFFQKTNAKKPYLALLSVIFFSSTLITYHAFQLFTPLFGLLLLCTNQAKISELWHQNKLLLIACFCIPVFTIAALILNNSSQANSVKFSGLSIFSKEHYAPILFEQRQRFPEKLSLIAHGYANTPGLIFSQVFSNLINITSPTFLFLTAGSHPSHHIPGLGLLHWFEVATLVVASYLFWKEKKPWQVFIFGWLILALLPACITFEATHPIRFLPGIVPLTVMSSYGLIQIIHKIIKSNLQAHLKKVVLLLICCSVLASYFYLTTTYFFQFPVTAKDTWPWYMEQVARKVWPIKDSYDKVIMQGESSSPYIYFLFYNALNPAELAQQMSYYPEDKEGFEHVKQLSTIYFQTVVWDDLEGHVDSVLYILRPSEIPGDKLTKPEYTILETITDPDSQQEFVLLEYDRFPKAQ